MRHRFRDFKRRIAMKLCPELQPSFMRIYPEVHRHNVETVVSETRVDGRSYEFLHSDLGESKYDAAYGLTRELANELKKYVEYTESYNEATDTWTLRVSVKVVV